MREHQEKRQRIYDLKRGIGNRPGMTYQECLMFFVEDKFNDIERDVRSHKTTLQMEIDMIRDVYGLEDEELTSALDKIDEA